MPSNRELAGALRLTSWSIGPNAEMRLADALRRKAPSRRRARQISEGHCARRRLISSCLDRPPSPLVADAQRIVVRPDAVAFIPDAAAECRRRAEGLSDLVQRSSKAKRAASSIRASSVEVVSCATMYDSAQHPPRFERVSADLQKALSAKSAFHRTVIILRTNRPADRLPRRQFPLPASFDTSNWGWAALPIRQLQRRKCQ